MSEGVLVLTKARNQLQKWGNKKIASYQKDQ